MGRLAVELLTERIGGRLTDRHEVVRPTPAVRGTSPSTLPTAPGRGEVRLPGGS